MNLMNTWELMHIWTVIIHTCMNFYFFINFMNLVMGTIYWSWLWQAVDYLCQHVHNDVIIKHLMTPIFRPNLDPKHQDICGMAKKDPSEICLIYVNQITLHRGIAIFVFVVANIKLLTFNKSYFLHITSHKVCRPDTSIHPSLDFCHLWRLKRTSRHL